MAAKKKPPPGGARLAVDTGSRPDSARVWLRNRYKASTAVARAWAGRRRLCSGSGRRYQRFGRADQSGAASTIPTGFTDDTALGSMGDRHRFPKAAHPPPEWSQSEGAHAAGPRDLRNNTECDGRHLFSVSYLTEPGTRPPYKSAANPRDPGGDHFGSHVFSSDDSGHHRFACGCGGENHHCSTWHLWGGSCRYPARHSATA
jgi:hypothetical protein